MHKTTYRLAKFLLFSLLIRGTIANQQVFESDSMEWRISLSREWDVLGPFPIQAREQHFLSPAFPLDLSYPYDHEPNRTWPSSYADDARVTWTSAKADAHGQLVVSFPNIRWEALRATEGWAALQHHSVLRTTLTLYPPDRNHRSGVPPSKLLIDIKQGSYFTILPQSQRQNLYTPVWHSGNIYNMHHAMPATVDIPETITDYEPVSYDLFVSGDYEIRLFGDPRDQGKEIPEVKISVSVSLEAQATTSLTKITRQPSYDVIPDFLDGFAFGDAIGIGIRNIDNAKRWWTVASISTPGEAFRNISLSLPTRPSIAPFQTRIIPILLKQTGIFKSKDLTFTTYLVAEENGRIVSQMAITVKIDIQQISWSSSVLKNIKASFFFATSHPTLFLVKPPKVIDTSLQTIPPILALHGAGVDVIADSFWADAIPRQERSWVIMPVGRTEWGLDWHGPSGSEAFACVHALSNILEKPNPGWKLQPDVKVILIGHSNGGQGVWYLASRYPDRVHAAIPAAAYIKSQAYVPLTHARSGHYIDPSLRAVLESSLTPDDNDLFLSNIKYIPFLALHGGNDTNVPTWHSREYYSVAKAWGKEDITFVEAPNKSHWYPDVFANEVVENFLSDVLQRQDSQSELSFTLSVIDPAHSGSLHGWKIEKQLVPGRMSRLHVTVKENIVHVTTLNVLVFAVEYQGAGVGLDLVINNSEPIETATIELSRHFTILGSGIWTSEFVEPRLSHGRIQNILDSTAPLKAIIPDPEKYPRALSVALRIAHELDIYHKLDVEIIVDKGNNNLLNSYDLIADGGNVIVIGCKKNLWLEENKSDFGVEDETWSFKGHALTEPSTGILFTAPHPSNPKGLVLYLAGTDDDGLERALRLFPFRTGVPVPDFVIVGKHADYVGAGGVLAAGIWNNEGRWSDAMGWSSWGY